MVTSSKFYFEKQHIAIYSTWKFRKRHDQHVNYLHENTNEALPPDVSYASP